MEKYQCLMKALKESNLTKDQAECFVTIAKQLLEKIKSEKAQKWEQSFRKTLLYWIFELSSVFFQFKLNLQFEVKIRDLPKITWLVGGWLSWFPVTVTMNFTLKGAAGISWMWLEIAMFWQIYKISNVFIFASFKDMNIL